MKSRLTKTGAAYEPAVFTGQDNSNTEPMNDMVLVLPDTAKETMGDKGLILKTGNQQTTEQFAAETGVVVAIGAGAFVWGRDRMREYVGRKPAIGDRVFYQRYAGQLCVGDDGVEYRLMGDKEIAAIQRTKTAVAPGGAKAKTGKSEGVTLSTGKPLAA